MSKRNLIFAGTPEFAVLPLKKILEKGHNVLAVFTQPDRPAGRGRKLSASPVKAFALSNNLQVFQPENLKSAETINTIKKLEPEVMVVVAYGVILPEAVLAIPKYGCLNIHASLLPRWRGAAPIQRAIEAGDSKTGISIMQMNAGLDTGDVLYELTTKIGINDNTRVLHDRLARMGGEAIGYVLDNLESLMPKPQDPGHATYAHKIKKSESVIDWRQPARVILNKINAFNPWPVAESHLSDKVYRIWEAEAKKSNSKVTPGTIIELGKQGIDVATGDGVLRITKIQQAGKKAIEVADFINSRPEIKIGQKFS